MKFEDLISELGDFGPYQKQIYFIVCLVAIPTALQTMAGVYTQATPHHRCAVPDLSNDTYASQGLWHNHLVNLSIPRDKDNEHVYDECHLRRSPEGLDNVTQTCDKWVYSKDPTRTTIVTDLDLVCDDKSKVTYAFMILMGGKLVGSLVMGVMSDLFGRKKLLVIASLGQFAAGLGIAWAQSYLVYISVMFLNSFFGVGMFMTGFAVGMEFVGPRQRRVAGIVIEFFWCLGLFLETAIAYVIRDWRPFMITISTFNIVIAVIFALFLPESCRWLIQKGKIEEASKTIEKAARVNGVTLSEKVKKLEDLEMDSKGLKIWHMFSHPTLVARALIVFLNWMVSDMVYYGLSLNAEDLSENIYLNVFLLTFVELAAYVFCLVFLDRAGRRLLMCFSMLLGGVACVSTIFPVMYGGENKAWVILVLSLVGKFGASASFAIIYIYTAELFPTVVRSSGLGVCSLWAKVGGIMAPYIADFKNSMSGNWGVALPLLIFGGLSVTAGLLVLLLPETSNTVLPDSVEDARKFGKSKKNKGSSYALDSEDLSDQKGSDLPTFRMEKRF